MFETTHLIIDPRPSFFSGESELILIVFSSPNLAFFLFLKMWRFFVYIESIVVFFFTMISPISLARFCHHSCGCCLACEDMYQLSGFVFNLGGCLEQTDVKYSTKVTQLIEPESEHEPSYLQSTK